MNSFGNLKSGVNVDGLRMMSKENKTFVDT